MRRKLTIGRVCRTFAFHPGQQFRPDRRSVMTVSKVDQLIKSEDSSPWQNMQCIQFTIPGRHELSGKRESGCRRPNPNHTGINCRGRETKLQFPVLLHSFYLAKSGKIRHEQSIARDLQQKPFGTDAVQLQSHRIVNKPNFQITTL